MLYYISYNLIHALKRVEIQGGPIFSNSRRGSEGGDNFATSQGLPFNLAICNLAIMHFEVFVIWVYVDWYAVFWPNNDTWPVIIFF